MRPCLSENEAVAFVGGRVSPEDRVEIAAHLDSCSACLGVVGGTASRPERLDAAVTVAVTPPGPAPGTLQTARIVALALVTVVIAGTGALFLSRPVGPAEDFPRRLAALRDESAALGAAAVAALPGAAFRETRTRHLNFGFTRDAIWLRLTVQNPEPVPRDVVLDATREWVTEVDLFEVVGGAAKPLARSGARVPLAERPIATERIAFPLTLAAGETRTLLIRLHGSSPLSFRGDVSTRAAFTSREAGDQLLFGGFYAILWGLAAYSLLLFATLRDRTQLLVGITLGFYGLAEATSHGHLSRLFPIGAGWFEISGGAAAFSVFLAALLSLARLLLGWPATGRLGRATRAAIWLVSGVAAVPVLFPRLHFLAFAALSVACIGTLAAVLPSTRRDVTTMFFFLATGSLLITGAPTLLVLFGAMPAFPFIEYANHVGAVAMSCLFSLLVADAIRQQREKIGFLNRELAAGSEELRFQVAARSRELVNVLARSVGPVAVVEIRPGEVFEERYRVLRHLGDGAWGRVYEVARLSDARAFALKVVTRARSGAEAARVAREAEIGARLSHPNLVGIVDIGVAAAGSPFLVMELVRGGSLEEQRARFGDVAWALPLLGGTAQGLAALHEARVVHRDLKPANVLLEGATAKVADFGIARVETLAGETATGDPLARPSSVAAPLALTRAGALMGTPAYMAPEAARGARFVGAPADVFAFGVMACEMLTGQPAFEDAPVLSVLEGRAPRRAARVAGPRVPASLSELLEACLAPEPAARPAVADLVASWHRMTM
jgi:hypothetical protein